MSKEKFDGHKLKCESISDMVQSAWDRSVYYKNETSNIVTIAQYIAYDLWEGPTQTSEMYWDEELEEYVYDERLKIESYEVLQIMRGLDAEVDLLFWYLEKSHPNGDYKLEDFFLDKVKENEMEEWTLKERFPSKIKKICYEINYRPFLDEYSLSDETRYSILLVYEDEPLEILEDYYLNVVNLDVNLLKTDIWSMLINFTKNLVDQGICGYFAMKEKEIREKYDPEMMFSHRILLFWMCNHPESLREWFAENLKRHPEYEDAEDPGWYNVYDMLHFISIPDGGGEVWYPIRERDIATYYDWIWGVVGVFRKTAEILPYILEFCNSAKIFHFGWNGAALRVYPKALEIAKKIPDWQKWGPRLGFYNESKKENADNVSNTDQ
jgi:hypothetical protein